MIDPPYTRFTRVKNTCPSDEGHINPGKRKRGGPDESPLRGALGPDVWYPTIPGSLEEKRPRVSNTTPKGGGGGTTVPHCLNQIPKKRPEDDSPPDYSQKAPY